MPYLLSASSLLSFALKGLAGEEVWIFHPNVNLYSPSHDEEGQVDALGRSERTAEETDRV
jgi:hypothetical protein